MVPRVSASSAPKGSSSSSILGWIQKARAMPTRCFMPPESCAGLLSMAGLKPTMATNFSTCALTSALPQSGQRDFTAKAMFWRTVSQGISAWLWNTTPRSRLGPVTSRPSMKTLPALAVSSPASTLRMVVLPQPEWPMMQTNSPRASEKLTSANTGFAATKALLSPSILSRAFTLGVFPWDRAAGVSCVRDERSLHISHHLLYLAKHQVQQHADDADYADGKDHVGQRQVVPLVPDKVANAGSPHQHLGRHNHQPGNAHADAHAGQNRRRGRRQDDLKSLA